MAKFSILISRCKYEFMNIEKAIKKEGHIVECNKTQMNRSKNHQWR